MPELHEPKLIQMFHIKGHATPDTRQGLMKSRRVIWMRIFDTQKTKMDPVQICVAVVDECFSITRKFVKNVKMCFLF